MQSAGARLKIGVLGKLSQTCIYILPVTKERLYFHYLAARPVSQTRSDPKYSVQIYN